VTQQFGDPLASSTSAAERERWAASDPPHRASSSVGNFIQLAGFVFVLAGVVGIVHSGLALASQPAVEPDSAAEAMGQAIGRELIILRLVFFSLPTGLGLVLLGLGQALHFLSRLRHCLVLALVPLSTIAHGIIVEPFDGGPYPGTFILDSDAPGDHTPASVGGFTRPSWSITSGDRGRIKLEGGVLKLESVPWSEASQEYDEASLYSSSIALPRDNFEVRIRVSDLRFRWDDEFQEYYGEYGIKIGERVFVQPSRSEIYVGVWTEDRMRMLWGAFYFIENAPLIDLEVIVEVPRASDTTTNNSMPMVTVIANGAAIPRTGTGAGGVVTRLGTTEFHVRDGAMNVDLLEVRTTLSQAAVADAILTSIDSSHCDTNGDGIVDAADLFRQ
jgi:hypothetical protein